MEQPVADRARVLEPLLLRQGRHPRQQRVGDRAGVAGEEADRVADDCRVLLGGLPPRTGSAAPAHLPERALGAVPRGRKPARALPQRHDLVDGGDGGLGGALRPERAEVAGAVGLDLADDREPGNSSWVSLTQMTRSGCLERRL